MTLGLRPIPFAIRLVDAAHFDVERCIACGARKGHTTYCMVRSWTRYSIQTPDCAEILDVLSLNPRG